MTNEVLLPDFGDGDYVPEDAGDDFVPEGYVQPDYDETEPLEGLTHDGVIDQ